MPARIVLVHADADFLAQATDALSGHGWDTKGYSTPAEAIKALHHASTAELLITLVEFRTGNPHGIALALMARAKRPALRVLFVAAPELKKHTEGISEVLALSISVPELVKKAARLLSFPA